nr:MAG TPA: Major capsid protein [Caudoviricetes sp.]
MYQLQKTLKMIALDVEYAIVNNSDKVLGATSTEGKFGGVPYFNNVNIVAATGGDFTEEQFNDAIQKAWAKGGMPDMVVVSGNNKRKVSMFTGNAQRQRNADSTKVKQIVDVYESDFGLVNLQLHRLQPDNRIDFLQTEYWKLAYLIPFKTYDRPKDSLMNGKVVTGQLTLECRSPEANAVINIAE